MEMSFAIFCLWGDNMSFLKNLLDIREIKGPEFYKDFESENKQLYDLEELFSRVKSEKRKKNKV